MGALSSIAENIVARIVCGRPKVEIYMTKAPNTLKDLNVGLGRTRFPDGQPGQSNKSPK